MTPPVNGNSGADVNAKIDAPFQSGKLSAATIPPLNAVMPWRATSSRSKARNGQRQPTIRGSRAISVKGVTSALNLFGLSPDSADNSTNFPQIFARSIKAPIERIEREKARNSAQLKKIIILRRQIVCWFEYGG